MRFWNNFENKKDMSKYEFNKWLTSAKDTGEAFIVELGDNLIGCYSIQPNEGKQDVPQHIGTYCADDSILLYNNPSLFKLN